MKKKVVERIKEEKKRMENPSDENRFLRKKQSNPNTTKMKSVAENAKNTKMFSIGSKSPLLCARYFFLTIWILTTWPETKADLSGGRASLFQGENRVGKMTIDH